MSAVIINIADFRRADKSIADRVADRLPGVALCIVRYAQVFAESYQRKSGCNDTEAVNAGVRCGRSQSTFGGAA